MASLGVSWYHFRGDSGNACWSLSQQSRLAQRTIQEGQPWIDKILLILFISLYCGFILFIPLDVFRFHWFAKPSAIVSALGLLLFLVGWIIISLSFKANTFAIPVVKVQTERHQTVIDTGVYSVVRHPMYTGVILTMIGMSLWLESYAAAFEIKEFHNFTRCN